MKIKTSSQSSSLKLILILLAAFILIAALPALFSGQKKFRKTYQSEADLSKATLKFMKKHASLSEVLDYFNEETIYLGVWGDASKELPESMRKELAGMGGLELSKIKLKEPYVGIIEKGQFIKEKKDDPSEVVLSHNDNKLLSGRKGNKRFCYLETPNRMFEVKERGLNVFIENMDGVVIGAYTFDYYQEGIPRSNCRKENFFFTKVPQVEIIIKEKNFLKLKEKRDKAYKNKVLLTSGADLVKAKINFDNQTYKSQIRLKGDWADHLKGDNWSFRVKLDTGNALLGMRKFSLHRPEARNFAGEWIFHELLKEEGLMNLQYHFVQVLLTIQGEKGETKKMLGMYALEEAFDKQVIERNQRREGIILKIDEDPLWQERAAFIDNLGLKAFNFLETIRLSDYENMNILPFGESRIKKDSVLFNQFKIGRSMLRAYIDGERKISEVFNIKKLAKYNAICNYLGGSHALIGHNYRFYYNPITTLLEPIGFDANAFDRSFNFFTYFHANEDEEYMKAFVEALKEVTDESYAEKIRHWPGLDDKIKLMKNAYPDYEFAWEILDDNRYAIQSFLKPKRSVNVFLEEIDDNYLRLNVENYGRFPIEVLNLENKSQRKFAQAESDNTILPNERKTISFKLDANFQRLFINKKKKKSAFNLHKDLEQVKINFTILGTNDLLQSKILSWSHKDVAKQVRTQKKSTVDKFDFLMVDEATKTITCKEGSWQIKSPLVIPTGYVFKVFAGTRLDLYTFRGRIICHSPIEFIGSKEAPIEVTSTYAGQGILVLNNIDTSYVQNCRFTNLSNPRLEGWSVSGAVNFYNAPVKMYNTLIADNHCEDALNIINTTFELDNVVFTNTQSDAFDGDFVNGIVKNSMFGDLGNDAIDVSGSNIYIDNVSIVNAGDKGLSAGEGSQMTAHNILITKSAIALAAKDKSTLKIYNATLQHNQLAFTAFQKKPEYGPAFMVADSIELIENKLNFLIEDGCVLQLNDEIVPTVKSVKEKMYGVEFGKSSK